MPEVADHEIKLDVLDIAQGVDAADVRNRRIVKGSQHVGQRIHATQMREIGGLFKRILSNGADVHIFHRSVRQLFGVVERGQTV